MNILILTPTALPTVTGNAMTVERWRSSLRSLGITVRVVATAQNDLRTIAHIFKTDTPDLIHAHHLLKTGALLLEEPLAGLAGSLPLVISPAGTDINRSPSIPALSEKGVEVCAAARAIVTQTPWLFDLLRKELPAMEDKIVSVPKAFQWLGNDPFDLRTAFQWDRKDFIFFCPAGVRPVKNNRDCLQWMERVYRARPRVRVVFAGSPIDGEYAARFKEEVSQCASFARWIEEIPPEAMRSAYRSADCILNTSRSEGLSNTLLEGIAAGKPLLASRIPGNRWPLEGDREDAPCGIMFDLDDSDDFVSRAMQLVDDETLCRRLTEACRIRAARLPRPGEEAEALLHLYERILNG